MAKIVHRNGKEIRLENPKEKYDRFGSQLKSGKSADGRLLASDGKAYLKGYRSAYRDGARAYKAKQRKNARVSSRSK